MSKNKFLLFKVFTFVLQLCFLVVLFFGCTIDDGKKIVPKAPDNGGGKIQSVRIIPSSVFSTAPEVLSTVDVSRSLMSIADTRSGAGILNPQKMTQLFMPLFTGLREPKENEITADNTTSDWIGFYMDRPVILLVVDKTEENDDSDYKLVLEFQYYQDNNMNKKVDIGGLTPDTLVAFVTVKAYMETGTAGKWELAQQISNPFNPSEQFKMTASGIYGSDQFSGTGVFEASSGDYTGTANLVWQKVASGKTYIRVEDGSILYKGSASTGYFNVTNLNMMVDIEPDGTSKVIEGSTITTRNSDGTTTIVEKQATTTNDQTGRPKEVAFTVGTTEKDRNGTITSSRTVAGAKKIDITTDGKISIGTDDAVNVGIGDIGIVDENAKEGFITVNASMAPKETVNKKITSYIYKLSDIETFSDGSVRPKNGVEPVSKAGGVVSSTYTAGLKTSSPVAPGNYTVFVMIDVNGDDNVVEQTGLDDNFLITILGVYVNGDISFSVGNTTLGQRGWIKFSGEGDGRISFDTVITFNDYSSGAALSGISGKEIEVGLFEMTSYGVNWSSPVARGFEKVPADLSKPFSMIIYQTSSIDYSRKYVVSAFIDLDGNYSLSKGDYFYNDMYMIEGSVLSAFEKGNDGNYVVQIKGFKKADDNVSIGVDYSIFSNYLDGSVPPSLKYYDGAGGSISGFAVIDTSMANTWYAQIMPFVMNPEEGASVMPAAVCKLSSNGAFNFKNLKIKDESGKRIIYMIIAFAYSSDDGKLKQISPNDYMVMKYREIKDDTGVVLFATFDPITFAFNDSKNPVKVEWVASIPEITSTVLSDSDKKLDFIGTFEFFNQQSGATDELMLSSDGAFKLTAKIGYDAAVGTFDERKTKEWLNFSDVWVDVYLISAYEEYLVGTNRMFGNPDGSVKEFIFIDFTKAAGNSKYKIKAAQFVYDPVKNLMVEYYAESTVYLANGNVQVELSLKEGGASGGTGLIELYMKVLGDSIFAGKDLDYKILDNNSLLDSGRVTLDVNGGIPIYQVNGQYEKGGIYTIKAYVDMNGNGVEDDGDYILLLDKENFTAEEGALTFSFTDFVKVGNGGGGGTLPELLAYYNFEGDFNDKSPNGRNLTNTGGVKITSFGKKGKGADFKAVSGYLENTAFPSGNVESFSITMWMTTTKTGVQHLFNIKGNSSSNSTQRRLSIGNSNAIEGYISNVYVKSDTNLITLNEWYHLAAVWNTTDGMNFTLSIYVDGMLVKTGSTSLTPNSTGEMRLGYDYMGGGYYFDGFMDEVRVYNAALDEMQILEDMMLGY